MEPRRCPVARSMIRSWRSPSGSTISSTRRSLPTPMVSIRAPAGSSIGAAAKGCAGARRRLAPRQPAGDHDDQDRGPGEDHHRHDDDQDLQRAHRLGAAVRGQRAGSCPLRSPGRRTCPGRRVEITIAPGDHGIRLDRALQRQLPELSRTRLKQLILSGQIAGDGRSLRDPAQRASAGARVVVMLPEPDEPTPAAQPIALDIRFEDRASDRRRQAGRHGGPSGPRQPRGHSRQCAARALRPEPLRDRRGAPTRHRPSPRQGHQRSPRRRQDRDGASRAVAAISRCAGSSAPTAPSSGACRRRPSARSSAISAAAPANRKKMAVVAETRGKSAVTRYRVERRFGAERIGQAALIECRLLTGRTHQIRVHLAHIGHPLIGDPAYGTRAGRIATRLRGRAAGGRRGNCQLSTAGPACPAARLYPSGPPASELTFDSPMPADMAGLLANLELL